MKRFSLTATMIALGALCACAPTSPEHGTSRHLGERLYSLIDLVPGFDPASGERYDEYVRDYNLTLSDCWDALKATKASEPAAVLSCEIQRQGEIGRGA